MKKTMAMKFAHIAAGSGFILGRLLKLGDVLNVNHFLIWIRII